MRRPSLRSRGCIRGADASLGWHAWAAWMAFGAFSHHQPPDEAAERRRRPSCGECPARELFVSSRAFSSYLGGRWGPTDGRERASARLALKDRPPGGLRI